ncbi:VMAP-C domain-containing protein [Streptomyces boluensis]|uniref:VMAP-C domain-containing protein n=1 Tax=Streptomyces boluensis TaxID=1775135 RepID=UPI0028AE64CE|nr:trypsin-like peptidase domain-containing protein [Streptomyces boluensis]
MNSPSWHARIGCGNEVGGGFLVSDRHVLTCAHVVAADAPEHGVTTTVTFPGSPALGPFTATVVAHGGWHGAATDPGDLAVLALDRPVPIEPARFAPLTEAYGAEEPKLLAYGFPQHYEEGTVAEFRVTADQLIAAEWVQLEAWSAYGQPLAPGFSGAAVVHADTKEVVGMVTAADRDPRIRGGRMLPSGIMARYWPRLGELIPTPGHTRADKAELRALIARAEAAGVEASPERLYRDAVGPHGTLPPRERFGSLWEAAWYTLAESTDPTAPARFAARLADFVDTDTATRHALQRWPGGQRQPSYGQRQPSYGQPQPPYGQPAPVPAPVSRNPRVPARRWESVLVEIEHSGAGQGQFIVSVSLCRGQERHPVGERSLPRGKVKAYALERISEAYRLIDRDAHELIAFALPRQWHNNPVHTWKRSKDDPTPLGSFSPVVVMDLARRRDPMLQHKLHQAWQELDTRTTGAELHRVECGSDQGQVSLTRQLRPRTGLLGFAAPPRAARAKGQFKAGLNAPVPVILWPQTGCEGGHEPKDDCPGTSFLDAVGAYVESRAPGELPYDIWELRRDSDQEWARQVTLFWEDPRCFPEPAVGFRHSPVG